MENSALAENRLDNKTVSNIALGAFIATLVGMYASYDPMISNLSMLTFAIFVAVPAFLLCVYRFAKQTERSWVFWLTSVATVIVAYSWYSVLALGEPEPTAWLIGGIAFWFDLIVFLIAAVKIRKYGPVA